MTVLEAIWLRFAMLNLIELQDLWNNALDTYNID